MLAELRAGGFGPAATGHGDPEGVVGVRDHGGCVTARAWGICCGRDPLRQLDRLPRPGDRLLAGAATEGQPPHLLVQVSQLDVLGPALQHGEAGP